MKKKQIYLFITSIWLSTNMLVSQTELNSSDSLVVKDSIFNEEKTNIFIHY